MNCLAAGILFENLFLSCSYVNGGRGILFKSVVKSLRGLSILIFGWILSLQVIFPLMCAILVDKRNITGMFVYSERLNPSSIIFAKCCKSPLGSITAIVDFSAKGTPFLQRMYFHKHNLLQP